MLSGFFLKMKKKRELLVVYLPSSISLAKVVYFIYFPCKGFDYLPVFFSCLYLRPSEFVIKLTSLYDVRKVHLLTWSSAQLFSYFLGGYGSNGASAQGFQSDGDSNNTTVSFPASLCSLIFWRPMFFF
jgi:hypothetical protein